MKPDLVIAANAFAAIDTLVGASSPAQETEMWRAAMTRTLTALAARAKRVVLVGAPPSSGNLQECVAVRSTPQACITQVQARWFNVRGADQAASAAAGTVYVDALGWFCYHDRCPAVIGSTPVYWDGVHLTRQYSKSLGPRLRGPFLGLPEA